MGLRILHDNVAGTLLESEVSSEYIINPGVRRHIESQVMKVDLVGPEVQDVTPGDIVILPPTGGVLVTLYDTETKEEHTYTLIAEYALLAKIPEEDAS